MKKIFPGLLLSLLFPAMLAAENTEESPRKPLSDANITGHVQDAATGEHLPYITVVVKGTTIGTATDGTGHYFLKNLPAGEFVLEASMLGYGTVEKRVTTTSGKTIEVNFVLTEDSERMDEIVVTANRNETNKKESSTIVNITSGKLFSAVGSSTLSESMNFTPGLRIENNCGNCAVTQLRINGLEGHYSQILLDSRPIFSSLATVYGLDQLPVSMIERVEVVRGGGSALYGANAIGGVVNIITKEPLYNTLNVSNITNVFGNGKLDINTSIGGAFVSDDHKAGMYIFGMVKDDRHRTRALVTPEGREIGIVTQQAVFSLIGQIQEETHRFAITYHHESHSKSATRSALDGIPGVGEKRRAELRKHFGTIKAIREADVETLAAVVPRAAAQAVYEHFHPRQEE